jgi:LPXTG-motif cell wall-anchored protein
MGNASTTTTDWRAFRRLGRGLAVVGLVIAAMGLLPQAASAAPNWDPADNAFLHEAHKGSSNPGFKTGDCPARPEGAAGDWGWHFVLPGNTSDFITIDVDFQNDGFTQHIAFVADPDGKHAYVYTSGPDTLLDARAHVSGTETEFVLSHVCTGTTSTTTTTTVPETTTTVPETTTTVPETTTTVPETTTTLGGGGGETATTAASVLGEQETRAVAGDALPRTGTNTIGLVVAGLVLILLGSIASRKATLVLGRD